MASADESAREWSYWTRNKLQILADYAPLFNNASKKSSERIYLDLMAGQPLNIDRDTKQRFDGSPLLALRSNPPFTRLRFGELGVRADRLESYLHEHFPGDDRFRVVKGDCNTTIDEVLADLSAYRWAPTFAFLDQQAAEIEWPTIEKLARFRRNKSGWKSELWILMSPAMIVREAKSPEYRERVSRLYGDDRWLRIQRARESNSISAAEYRDAMVNLMRFRLESDLGYKFTHRIPMKMLRNSVQIFDMVFATDHPAGDRIMRNLYNKAAEREPRMRQAARDAQIAATGQFSFFDDIELEVGDNEPAKAGQALWKPSATWDPSDRDWWHRFA
ncbi:three-Cys-motif partner protein TcmP [Williamsia sp. SKLECPSW1]